MKQRKLTLFIICSFVAMLLTSCQQSADDSNRPDGADTVYTEPKAMSIHRNNPERALVIIDSAVIVGNITPMRGEYLKAITQYGGLDNYPLARQTCLQLLDDIDQKANSKTLSRKKIEVDSVTLLRVYQLLATIEHSSGNYPAAIRYATEASRLAHSSGDFSDIASSESTIAKAMAHTGRTDEGIDRLDAILEELQEEDSFQGVVVYTNTAKHLLHILVENGRLTKMIPVCEAMLKRVRDLRDHPDRFSGIAEGFDTSEFTDMAEGQALVFLAAAYARLANSAGDGMGPQYLAKARATEANLQRLPWSKTLDCERMMSGVYHFMGEFERFDKAMDLIVAKMGDDTINVNNFIRLTSCCVAAKMRGRLSEAIEYLERASIVRDSLDARNQREQLNELATVYHLQEEQLARKEA